MKYASIILSSGSDFEEAGTSLPIPPAWEVANIPTGQRIDLIMKFFPASVDRGHVGARTVFACSHKISNVKRHSINRQRVQTPKLPQVGHSGVEIPFPLGYLEPKGRQPNPTQRMRAIVHVLAWLEYVYASAGARAKCV